MNVQILMSTYNGEKYIHQQLDSLLAQNYQNISVLIRDDGSTDKTVEILIEYAKADSRLSWYQGENLGPAKSFFDLIMHADSRADYIMFADQDDVWLDGKIDRALKILRTAEKSMNTTNIPSLYCGNTYVVDENLNTIERVIPRKVRRLSFGNALVQNICTGCTAAINHELLKLLQQSTPNYMIMHDWWLYLTASCFGSVVYDNQSYIKYRQHGHNTSGAMTSHEDLLKYRIKQIFKKRGEIYLQAEEFLTVYPEISEFNKRLICLLLKSKRSFAGRIQVVFNTQFFRQKRSDDLLFRIITLFGKL